MTLSAGQLAKAPWHFGSGFAGPCSTEGNVHPEEQTSEKESENECIKII